MAALITIEDVKPLMADLGFSVPDTVLNLLLEQAAAASVCMDGAGYTDSVQKLLLIYAVTRLAALSGAKKLSSQSAPSGASRSFTYDAAGTDHLYRQIQSWDTNECLSSLPMSGSAVGLFLVVDGSC